MSHVAVSPVLIQCREVRQVYDSGNVQRVVLDGVSCDLAAGRIVALMGPSGSGKSTLLNIVGGLQQPSSGSVVVGGEALERLNPLQLAAFRARAVGFVFQEWNLIKDLTALENVALPLRMRGASRTDAVRQALEAMKSMDVAELAAQFPDRLSGGEQQRVSIARAIVDDRQIVLADEPTGALDRDNGRRVMTLLRSVVDAGTRTCLIATHDPMVAQSCDEVWALEDGRLSVAAQL